MSINLPLLKDAVARWETYEDRGIRPHFGWRSRGDGNSCALGDIAHYTGTHYGCAADGMRPVSRMLGLEDGTEFAWPEMRRRTPWMTGINDDITESCAGFWLAAISDSGRWPIEEVRRLIEWEEAALAFEEAEAAEAACAPEMVTA